MPPAQKTGLHRVHTSPSGDAVRKLNVIIISWVSLLYQRTKLSEYKYRACFAYLLGFFSVSLFRGNICHNSAHLHSKAFTYPGMRMAVPVLCKPLHLESQRCSAMSYITQTIMILFRHWGLLKPLGIVIRYLSLAALYIAHKEGLCHADISEEVHMNEGAGGGKVDCFTAQVKETF